MKNPKPFKIPAILPGKIYTVFAVEGEKEGSTDLFYWSEDSAALLVRDRPGAKVVKIQVIADKNRDLRIVMGEAVKVSAPTEEETRKLALAKKLREAGLSAEELDLLKVPNEFRP